MNDALLLLAADLVDDLEKVRIANENRLRSLAGFSLEGTAQASCLADVVNGLVEMEDAAVCALRKTMRQHPLGSWVKATIGVGEKQGARLLASIGDPYWNPLHQRPRTVSELWAYCGLHVLPVGHTDHGIRNLFADGDQKSPRVVTKPKTDPATGHVDLTTCETHGLPVGVAPRRIRGQRVNWSPEAKVRAYLVALSCMKHRRSPYRTVYDARREHTAETHPEWTPGHSHNDALRITSKAILKDLWLEARALHLQQSLDEVG